MSENKNRKSTKELVDVVIAFCELFGGLKMYPYQEQFARRIIRSVLTNDGNEISALFSRQSGKSETVSLVSAGLMVILPELANMPMFLDDPRLQMFKNGVMIGIFAPSQRQAQTTYGKIRNKVESPRGMDILSHEFNVGFSTSNGTTVALTNGSFVTAISASDGANIEGESFHIIICEECLPKGTPVATTCGLKNIEDIIEGDSVLSYNHTLGVIEPKRVERSFSQPLYGRKMVNIHLSNGEVLRCTDNHKIFLTNKDGYFRADLASLGDSMLSCINTTQEEGINSENRRQPDAIRLNFGRWQCRLSCKRFKEPPIHYKPVYSPERLCNLQVPINKRVMQSATKRSPEHGKRHYNSPLLHKMSAHIQRVSRTLLLKRREEKCYKRVVRYADTRRSSLLVYGRWINEWDDGVTHERIHFRRKQRHNKLFKEYLRHMPKNIVRQENSEPQPFISRKGEKQVSQTGTSLHARIDDVQDTNNRRREEMSSVRKYVCTLSPEFPVLLGKVQGCTRSGVLQREIPKIEEVLITSISIEDPQDLIVYDLTVEDNHNFFANSVLVHNCQDISDFKLRKSIHPMGAAYNASIIKIGTASTKKGNFYNVIQRNKQDFEDKLIRIQNHFEYDYIVVSKYNEKYRKYVEQEKKRLGEKSDEFRMSYMLEWILQRGMFIDIADFEANNVNPDYDIVPYDKTATHVVGIDVGGGSDSTVVTVTEVDWKMPVVLESRTDEETGEEVFYQCYNTYVKAWKEISNTPNFEEQYTEIMHFLSNYKIARVVIDTTKERALADRINANTAYEVVQYVFSSKSKSDLYKNFEREVNSGRVNIPGGEETKKTGEYNRCLAQLQDLEKSWRGSYMVVAHPPTKEGRDDYPDSMALSILGCMNKGFVNEITTTSDRRGFISGRTQNMYLDRNKFTGRRR